MLDKKLLWIGGGIAAAFLVLPKLVRAAPGPDAPFVTGTAVTVRDATINLTDIAGTSWTKPIYLTIERDIRLGQPMTETPIQQRRFMREVGEAVNLLFAEMNSVYRGVVVPALINPGGRTAQVIAKTSDTELGCYDDFGFWSALWTGISTVSKGIATGATAVGKVAWTGISTVGKGAWWGAQQVRTGAQKLWSSTAGIRSAVTTGGKTVWKYATKPFKAGWSLLEGSEPLQKAVAGIGAVAAGQALQKHNASDVSGQAPGSPTGPTPGGYGAPMGPGGPVGPNVPSIPVETVLLGYASETKFNPPAALEITKMHNPDLKDTSIVTDAQTLQRAQELKYNVVEQLGFASSEPFKDCVPLIRLFNETTVDTIVISNVEAVSKMEAIGYDCHGVIGYIKAAG